jgi:NAD(P)-dependent dehydrogenase (short-subunit alcohol dehydrogenase family)
VRPPIGEAAPSEVGAAGVHVADLGSLGEVRGLAEDVARAHERLDALVNNAGVVVDEPAP